MNKAGLIKNKLAEKDQVRMVVRNILPNLVERLQIMNPKSFVDLYDDGYKLKRWRIRRRRTPEVQ